MSLPVKIVEKLFAAKKKILNGIGLFLWIVVVGCSYYLALVNAALMGVKTSNEWAFAYI